MRSILGTPAPILAFALLTVACDEESAPKVARQPEPDAAVESKAQRADAISDELGLLPAPQGPLMDARFADKYARRDSKLDGWDTELFNERAGKQLGALGKLVAHPADLDAQHLQALVDAAFECVDLRPECSPVATPHGVVRVARNDQPSTEIRHRGVDGALAALRAIAAGFEGATDVAMKFKIVGVEPGDERVVTRCYVQAGGRSASGVRQLNATWRCTWTPLPSEPADALPRLVRVELDEYAESVGPAGGAPLFAEATVAVLGGDAAFREQLQPSLESWAARLDRSLGISLLGHEGLALGDVDGDLLDDVYVCQPGGLPNRLFVRQRDGSARDMAHAAGVDVLDASRSALFADFDNDGDQDLALVVDPDVFLFANDGHGRFTQRCKARAPSTTSLSAVDFDGDGDLDLFGCGYVVPDRANVTPLPYDDANNGQPNTLLRNDSAGADWVFSDATYALGLDENNRRFSFAAAWEDYDGDGDQDLYVANDFGRNNLYRNDGGTFSDVAAAAGVEDRAAGMGVTWGDYDLDGRPDLYVSNMFSSAGERVTYQPRFKAGEDEATRQSFRRHARGNSLWRNMGDGTFRDVSEAAGVTLGRWAWGALFTDFDDDGLSDLFVPNGFVTGEDPEDL